MQELIFIIILAVFIGGMLWSDRDSRRLRYGEFAEQVLRGMAERLGISYKKLTGNYPESEEK